MDRVSRVFHSHHECGLLGRDMNAAITSLNSSRTGSLISMPISKSVIVKFPYIGVAIPPPSRFSPNYTAEAAVRLATRAFE